MAASHLNKIVQHIRQVVLGDDGGMTDGQLLESFLATRDEAAFDVLLQRHGRMVLGVCERILHNPHDVDDAFQATFLVLVRKAAALLSRQTVGDWLYGVAYNTALKARAAAGKRQVMERRAGEMSKQGPPADDIWGEVKPLLDRELNRLPDKYRRPIVLCDLEGKTRKAAAEQLGWPEGTVSGRLARARVLLAERLTRQGVVVSGGLLALLLCRNAAGAGLPPALAAATAKAATLAAAGQAAATGAISAKAAALTEGVLKGMALAKLKTAAAVLLAIGIVGSGVGVFAWRMAAAGPAEQQAAAGQIDKAYSGGDAPNQAPRNDAANAIPPALSGKVPPAVRDAVMARFPDAEWIDAAKETEAGKQVYSVVIKHRGQNIDVTVIPDGTITFIEKEIAAQDLPPAVARALESKYPGAKLKKVEEVFTVEATVETLDSYEVLLFTARRRMVGVGVAPDGTIVKARK